MDRLFVPRDKPEYRELLIPIKYVLNSNKRLQLTLVIAKLSYLRLFGPILIWLSPTVGVKIVQICYTNDKETIILEWIFMIEYFIFEL